MKKMMKTLAILSMMLVALPVMAQKDLKLTAAEQKKYEAYQKQLAAFDSKIEVLSVKAEAEPAKLPEIRQQAMDIYEEKLGLEMKIIRENANNMIPAAFVGDVAYNLEYDELVEICNPKNAYYNHPAMDVPKKLLKSLEKRAPGKMYIDMTIKDMNGKARKLSEWVGKGKYVMIDFWASWCGPCRQEMPNVVKNYAKYHAKGFEIIGISFDQKADAWKKAVAQLGMKWPQLSDLGGWQSAAAGVYGINSIPASILLDGKGKIVAVNLRGEQLGAKLKEIYGF